MHTVDTVDTVCIALHLDNPRAAAASRSATVDVKPTSLQVHQPANVILPPALQRHHHPRHHHHHALVQVKAHDCCHRPYSQQHSQHAEDDDGDG